MVDLLDVKPLIEKRKASHASQANFQAQVRHQLEVDLQYVTSSREWNAYLQLLQAMLDTDEKAMESIKNTLLADRAMPDADRETLMRQLKRIEGRIQARRDDMSLPVTICHERDKLSHTGQSVPENA